MSVPLETIAATLGFTLEELALNRAGRMSPHQIAESVRSAVGISGTVLVAVGATLIVLFLGRPTGAVRILVTILCLGLVALCTAFSGQAVAGAVRHEVLTDEGTLEFKSGPRLSTMVVVGRFRSVVNDASKVLTPGERYRVFYARHSEALLSIEPLREAPSEQAAPGGSGSGAGGTGP